jgi:Asp-tRNA(Asn)/Glu-tRNA(Gln) amidotransferase A subunit family amidase
LARTVDDITLSYLAMAGPDRADGWSHHREVVPPRSHNGGTVTIGVVEQWAGLGPLSTETKQAIAGFLEAASKAGFNVEVVNDPALLPPQRLANASGPEILAVHGVRFAEDRAGYGTDLQERLDQCADGTPEDMIEAAAWAAAASNTVDRLTTEGIDLLVAPTVGGNRKVIGEDTMEINTSEISSETFFHRKLLASFTAPINRIGLPSLAAPIAQKSGLPFSVQLIAPKWQEHTILHAAKRLESSGILGSGVPPELFT